MTVVDFLGGMFGTRLIEIIAALCGLINVVLIIRRSLWNYPFGFIMVTLYAWVFFESKLYSDALLQVYFFIIQIFGFVWWVQGRDTAGIVKVRAIPAGQVLLWALAAIICTGALGFIMSYKTDAALPFWDAAITVLSVVAQTLMARRYVQSWLVWILVDALAIGVFIFKDLTPTAALYAIFLGLAIQGWFSWQSNVPPGEMLRI
jgi:nicotinamide mononucleotide transporter